MKTGVGIVIILSVTASIRADEPATQPVPSTQLALVTLHLDSVAPKQALEEFTKQTGIGLKTNPENLLDQTRAGGNAPPVSMKLDVDQESFWSALGKLCAAANLVPEPYVNEQGNFVTLRQAGTRSNFTTRPQNALPQGIVFVSSISRNANISFNGDAPQTYKSCALQLSAFLDPRLRVTKVQLPKIETAEDENGKAITVVDPQRQGSQQANSFYSVQNLQVPLNYDPKVSQKLATLKGSLKATASGAPQKVEIPDLASLQGVEKKAAGMRIIFDEVKFSERSVQIRVSITRMEVGRDAFREAAERIGRDFRFQTADGRLLIANGGGGSTIPDATQQNISCNWNNDSDKPVKLVWEFATQTNDIDLPFEFHDLTLP